jgi:hypothetical protein
MLGHTDIPDTLLAAANMAIRTPTGVLDALILLAALKSTALVSCRLPKSRGLNLSHVLIIWTIDVATVVIWAAMRILLQFCGLG